MEVAVKLNSIDSTLPTGRQAVNGAFSLTAAAVILKIVGLIYKIPLQSLLGDEGMGYFNSAYTVYSLFYLICTSGVPRAITMLVSRAAASGESKGFVLRCAKSTFFIIGLLGSIIFALLSGQISELIGNGEAAATMLAVAPSVLFVSVAGVYRGYLTAGMKMLTVAVSQIIDGVGKLAFGLILAYYAASLGYSAAMISAYTILGVTLGSFLSLVYLWICSRSISEPRNVGTEHSSTRGHIIRSIFAISIPITVSSAVMSIGNLIDLGMIMRRLSALGYGSSEASRIFGNYTTLAVPMFNLVIALVGPVSVAYLPLFASARRREDKSALEDGLRRALSLSAFLCAPMVLGIAVFSREILELLFPSADIALGAPLLSLLMPAAALMSILLIVNTALEADGRVKAPLCSMIIGSAVKIVVGYIMLSYPKFGISGAPVGTVLCYASALVTSIGILEGKSKIKAPIFTTHIIPYLNAFISVSVARSLSESLPPSGNGAVSLVISILVCGAIYLLMSLFTGCIDRLKMPNIAKCTKM